MWTVWSTTGDRTEHRKNRPVMCVGRRKNKTQTHQKRIHLRAVKCKQRLS